MRINSAPNSNLIIPASLSRKQRGVTLVETLISIIILSVSFAAIASVLTNSVVNSNTPVLREQATSLAEAYLEMVSLQAYSDPNQTDSGSCDTGETTRTLYDDVNDFDCILDNDGARDQLGALITGLGAYNIAVNTQATTLNGATATQIDVIVTHDAQPNLTVSLTGYRVNYP